MDGAKVCPLSLFLLFVLQLPLKLRVKGWRIGEDGLKDVDDRPLLLIVVQPKLVYSPQFQLLPHSLEEIGDAVLIGPPSGVSF